MKLVVGLGHWSSCRVTSAPNSFDFKRYRLNPTLWCPFIYVLFISAFNWLLWQSQPCSQLPDFPSVFLWDCHIRLKERLWLIRAVAVGSHKGSCGFCNSLYFPLQKPLPASNQLPSIKGQKKKKKGCSQEVNLIMSKDSNMWYPRKCICRWDESFLLQLINWCHQEAASVSTAKLQCLILLN